MNEQRPSKEKLPDWLRRWYALKGELRFREAADEIEHLQRQVDALRRERDMSATVAGRALTELHEKVTTHEPGARHERRVVGHASGWQEQMDTCVCGQKWPCPGAAQPPPAAPSDDEQVRAKLWDVIKSQPGRPLTQKDLAGKIGVSLPFLNDILRGNREPSGKVLTFLGLERVVTYRYIKKRAAAGKSEVSK